MCDSLQVYVPPPTVAPKLMGFEPNGIWTLFLLRRLVKLRGFFQEHVEISVAAVPEKSGVRGKAC